VRRGASWTAAYHLQLTVAAVAWPVHSSVMPSSSVLLRGPGCCSRRRRLLGGAASGHPAAGVVAVVDAARTPPWRRSPVSGRRCPPSRFVVRDPAVQPAVSGRPVSGTRVGRPGSGDPAGCPPPVRCPPRPLSTPSAVHPFGVRPSGVQSAAVHPIRPVASVSSTLGGGAGTRSRRPGDPAPQQRVEVAAAAALSGGRVDGRGALGAGDAAWGRAVVSRGSVAGPDRVGGGGGRACPLRGQAGQAGVRSARGWRRRCGRGSRPRRELAAPAGWLPCSGWG
jgi:hypothetical protein